MRLARRLVLFSLFLSILTFVCASAQSGSKPSPYLFVWARSADTSQPDFLAVVDSLPTSPTYGRVIASVSTGIPVNFAHHTNYDMPPNGILFANDYSSGISFRFDLRDPRHPKLLGMFGNAGPYSHAHSFVYLDNDHVLATYQMYGFMNKGAGALAELNGEGKMLRYGDAADPAVDEFIRPYSLAVASALDRVVTSSADMYAAGQSQVVQVWRLSDLKRIKTIKLPPGPRGVEGINAVEPRLLANQKTVLVSTDNCGLYRITGLETDDPSAELVYDSGPETRCMVPAVAGKYWIQSVTHGKPHIPNLNLGGPQKMSMANDSDEWHALVVLDVSNPGKPVEISRLKLEMLDYPHWLSVEPSGRRLVLTGFEELQNRVVLIDISDKGELAIDLRFSSADSAGRPGIVFKSDKWPHGGTGLAVPHGAVFSRP